MFKKLFKTNNPQDFEFAKAYALQAFAYQIGFQAKEKIRSPLVIPQNVFILFENLY